MSKYIVTFRCKNGEEYTTHDQPYYRSFNRACTELRRAHKEFEREYADGDWTRIKMYDVSGKTTEQIMALVVNQKRMKAIYSLRIRKNVYNKF